MNARSEVWVQCSTPGCQVSGNVTQTRLDELIREGRAHLCNVCHAKYGEYQEPA